MRFNVVSLAWALAVPVLSAQVGWQQGHEGGVVQEWDTPPAAASVTSAPVITTTSAPNPKNEVGNASHQSTSTAGTAAVIGQAQHSTQSIVSTPAVISQAQHSTQSIVSTPAIAAKASATPTPSPVGNGGSSAGSGGAAPKGGQILYMVNKYGAGLSIVTDKSGGPDPTGGKGTLASGETATVTIPSGWAGRFAINPTGVPAGNQDGTKIEGAITTQTFWDISLVDGYTVPITCTCGSDSTPFIGCNIDLFKQSAKCPSPNGDALCLNPARVKNTGPADPWFAACKDASYTYPQNDVATQSCAGGSLTCCIGSSCAAGKNQGKRWINPVYARWAYPRNAFAST